MAKTKYDYRKHFSLFFSNPRGWSLLAQLWETSLKDFRAGMGSLPGIKLSTPPPPTTTQGQHVLKLAQN